MGTKTEATLPVDHFKYLPSYAGHLLTHRIKAYTTYQVALLVEFNVPLLIAFKELDEEDKVLLGMEVASEELYALAHIKADLQNEDFFAGSSNNQSRIIDEKNFTLSDAKLITFIRKKCFLRFINEFCTQPEELIALVEEIDIFLIKSETDNANFNQEKTEQIRLQQQLKNNQTFIQKIADATPSIIATYNVTTGQYTFISWGVKKLLGYNPEEVKEKGVSFFSNIIHPDDVAPLFEKNAQALNDANLPENRDRNDVIEFIYRMRHKEGHYIWFHTYGTIFDRNEAGLVEHVLNISLDITEQRAAVKKIEEQEHFIQQIADASPTVLYVFDIETNSIVYVNKEIFFVLGYTRDEIIKMDGSVTEQLYHPEDISLLPERKQSNKKILEQDIMLQYECRLKNKDGEWQWFLVREVVFKTDEKGKVLQTVGAALDISRRKEMEKTLLQNSFLLEQSNASLEEFAYVASHDLKEPLRKISTFGDRLADSQVENLTPEGKLYLRKIVDASQRMQLMINDLLSISMISGNKSFQPTSLEQICKETLQTLEYKIEQKNALIKSDNLPAVQIIPSQFRQLFQNLISNSLKFVRDDVQPLITITHSFLKPDDVAHYQLAAAERFLRIEFADNGIGFEMEYAGKIFAIFQRLHGRSEYEGSGIGLAICKKIVEHHGGVIYAAGAPNVGATFTIILPA